MVDILIRKHFTKEDHVRNAEATGRRRGKPVGSYIVDLADLKKAIVLCSSCVSGFNPKPHHYVRHKTIPYVRGQCDGCKGIFQRALMFVHESFNY